MYDLLQSKFDRFDAKFRSSLYSMANILRGYTKIIKFLSFLSIFLELHANSSLYKVINRL